MIADVKAAIHLSLTPRFKGRFITKDISMFLYECSICIENRSEEVIQLLGKHWFIHTRDETPSEIVGLGFDGNAPIIHPGESFIHHTLLPLDTFFGFIQGDYSFQLAQHNEVFIITTEKIILSSAPYLN
ncbi:MAG: ApaG domain-containing protein [Cryomorphaceae bacterium]|nr:ApaG domain-containing protein [Cryomorphaceae bacterium]